MEEEREETTFKEISDGRNWTFLQVCIINSYSYCDYIMVHIYHLDGIIMVKKIILDSVHVFLNIHVCSPFLKQSSHILVLIICGIQSYMLMICQRYCSVIVRACFVLMQRNIFLQHCFQFLPLLPILSKASQTK